MSHLYRHIPELLGSVWAISPNAVPGALLLFQHLLDGKVPADSSQNRAEHQPKETEAGPVIVPIRGVVTKYDQECGPLGTLSLIDKLNDIDANPKVNQIIFRIDSGGGEASGTQLLVSAIRALSTPTAAYIEGMACSAAMWIALACDTVTASAATDTVGSIGTMVSFADYRPAFEKQGIKLHEIYATKSKDKNADFLKALEGDYEELRKNFLDPMNEAFHASVKMIRPQANASVFSGKTYTAAEGITLGLVDRIGSLESILYNTNLNTMAEKRFTLAAITAALMGNSKAVAEPIIGKTPEELESENAAYFQELADVTAENVDLKRQNDGLSLENTALKSAFAELKTKFSATADELKEAKAEYMRITGAPVRRGLDSTAMDTQKVAYGEMSEEEYEAQAAFLQSAGVYSKGGMSK